MNNEEFFDEEFFNSHPLFRHLMGGIIKDVGDGWTEKSKVICENRLTAAEDLARDYKLANTGYWRNCEESDICYKLQSHPEIKLFLDEIKEGDKVESYVAFKDFLAASGAWRIIRNKEIVKYLGLWNEESEKLLDRSTTNQKSCRNHL